MQRAVKQRACTMMLSTQLVFQRRMTALCVIFVWILGVVSVTSYSSYYGSLTRVSHGLIMGTASHALGAARCAELDCQEWAFSSLTLIIVASLQIIKLILNNKISIVVNRVIPVYNDRLFKEQGLL
ncbi:MAG: Antiholin-like protein LrgB [Sodalis sp.]|nr:MAG: Antiholin-like protein LrgB [Sodalis sp.]